ncbi:MAG: hypothetical protein J6T54_12890 [Fibrobacter sp.]|nr:hypothetical protein [Fibrobacter sp.]
MATETQAPATPDSTDKVNAKLNKMELMKKFKQHRDSVNKAILDLQKDSLRISKDLEMCNAQLGHLQLELNQIDSLNKEVTKLQTELQEAIKQQSPVAALASPSGCAVLIVLIIAITAIALKKGFSISKGDTKLSVGDKDKE